ncbi:cytochrome P450 [Saccharopolyspora erythraea]|uniref:cytochrome P450 n=1 Tax=Saccharopolyspora erythraea TaxID=1836 RepID=UPI001BEF642D|nr:cytochrome P450 [Saccharopolyspora erythraea]QUH03978.1 cytochrome P450 [Saccharopolyspora erythraea]
MTSQHATGEARARRCPARRTPLHGPEFAEDPSRTYDQLREEGPAAPVELGPGVPATLVVSYDMALEVLRDPTTFSKDPRRWQAGVPADSPVLPMMGYRPNCQFSDGDRHARLRRAVTDCLSHVNPNAVREHVERSADALINEFGSAGEADLLPQYAGTLTLRVLTWLFGCPPDLGKRLLADMAHIADAADAGAAAEAGADLDECLRRLVHSKRGRPGRDVTSRLMAHSAQLSDDEVVHQLVILMGISAEAQQHLISNALRLLLSDERFAGDLSGGSLPVEDALDEVLWADPPIANHSIAYPTREVHLDGVHLPQDEPVVISLAAANRDPARTSTHRVGNRAHLAFGAGPHGCPAQRPARIIASAAIEKLLDRLPEMRLACPTDRLSWRPGPFYRGLTALPVRFPPVAAVPLQDDAGAAPPSAGDVNRR